ncbi:hypothetical protein B0H12DRAFT_1123474, partial [Mycena haematopus]
MVLGIYEEASAIIPRLLSLSQAVGAPLDIAQSLELLAFSCAGMMDLPGARVAYQGARIQFTKFETTQLGRSGVDRCSNNLRRLEGMIEMDRSILDSMVVESDREQFLAAGEAGPYLLDQCIYCSLIGYQSWWTP